MKLLGLIAVGLVLLSCSNDSSSGGSSSSNLYASGNKLATEVGCPFSFRTQLLENPISRERFMDNSGQWEFTEVELVVASRRNDGTEYARQFFAYPTEDEGRLAARVEKGCQKGTEVDFSYAVTAAFETPSAKILKRVRIVNETFINSDKVRFLANIENPEGDYLHFDQPKGLPAQLELFESGNDIRIARGTVFIDAPEGKSTLLIRANYQRKAVPDRK